MISSVLHGRGVCMAKLPRLHGLLKFSESTLCYREQSCKVDFPSNLPKANVIIGVLYCHAAERMLICTYANSLSESSVPSVYLCF